MQGVRSSYLTANRSIKKSPKPHAQVVDASMAMERSMDAIVAAAQQHLELTRNLWLAHASAINGYSRTEDT